MINLIQYRFHFERGKGVLVHDRDKFCIQYANFPVFNPHNSAIGVQQPIFPLVSICSIYNIQQETQTPILLYRHLRCTRRSLTKKIYAFSKNIYFFKKHTYFFKKHIYFLKNIHTFSKNIYTFFKNIYTFSKNICFVKRINLRKSIYFS